MLTSSKHWRKGLAEFYRFSLGMVLRRLPLTS